MVIDAIDVRPATHTYDQFVPMIFEKLQCRALLHTGGKLFVVQSPNSLFSHALFVNDFLNR
jgi:hypothetical protein